VKNITRQPIESKLSPGKIRLITMYATACHGAPDTGPAAADHPAHQAAPPWWDALGSERVRGGRDASDEQSLDDPEREEDDRGRDADRRVCRYQAHGGGGETDTEQGGDHDLFAAVAVGECTEQCRRRRGASRCSPRTRRTPGPGWSVSLLAGKICLPTGPATYSSMNRSNRSKAQPITDAKAAGDW